MTPQNHQRAVEILETRTGIEYSEDVERTQEWGDAVAAAVEEGLS